MPILSDLSNPIGVASVSPGDLNWLCSGPTYPPKLEEGERRRKGRQDFASGRNFVVDRAMGHHTESMGNGFVCPGTGPKGRPYVSPGRSLLSLDDVERQKAKAWVGRRKRESPRSEATPEGQKKILIGR